LTAEQLRAACLKPPGAEETFPFGEETSVFKVAKKIFAISSLESETLTASVKCDPEISEALRGSHESVAPGYHLNKRHWITVTINGDVDDGRVRDLIEDSYDLVKPKRKKVGARRAVGGRGSARPYRAIAPEAREGCRRVFRTPG